MAQAYCSSIRRAGTSFVGAMNLLEQHEPDRVVRKLVRCQLETAGGCNHESFRFAQACFLDEQATGFSSVLRAMVFAGFCIGEIAQLTNIDGDKIVAFCDTFWDLSIFRAGPGGMPAIMVIDPRYRPFASAAEGILLTAAYWGEFTGLRQILTPEIGPTPYEAQEARAMLTDRRYVPQAVRASVERHPFTRIYFEMLAAQLGRSEEPTWAARERGFVRVVRAVASGTPVTNFLLLPGVGINAGAWVWSSMKHR